MTLQFELQVTRQCTELFRFIDEVNRLSYAKANFSLGCTREAKLYVYSCKELQNTTYAPMARKGFSNSIVAILNYAISQMATLNVSLDNETTLCFEISGYNVERVWSFALGFTNKFKVH